MMGACDVATGIPQYLGGGVANLASVPGDVTDPVQTPPIHTSLFNKRGVGALVRTAIARAVLPLMRKLPVAHHVHD